MNRTTKTTGAAKKTARRTKRRANGEGAIGQVKTGRDKGLWVGRLEGGVDPKTNKRRRIKVSSRDFNEMKRKLEEAKRQLEEVGYVADPTLTVRDWTERWLVDILSHRVRPKTYSTYASLIRKHVQPVLGAKRLARLTPADVRAVRDGIVGKGLSTTTALQTYRVLSKCLEDARRDDLVTQNVCDRVDAPNKAVTTTGAFTVPQTKALLAKAADTGGSRHIARLLMGIRQSEGLGLTLDAVDLDRGTAQIVWQLQELQYKHGCGPGATEGQRDAAGRYACGFKQGGACPARAWRVQDGAKFRMLQDRLALVEVKSRKGNRSVPMLPPVVAAIRAHLAVTADQPNPYGLVWHTATGAPINHKDDQTSWKDLVESVGLPRTCTTHWARHSVATLLKQVGVDTLVIGEIVGHGAASVTEGYIHISSAQAVDAMGRLGRILTA